MLANLIHQGLVKGYIAHKQQARATIGLCEGGRESASRVQSRAVRGAAGASAEARPAGSKASRAGRRRTRGRAGGRAG
jgi:hypothetical protein